MSAKIFTIYEFLYEFNFKSTRLNSCLFPSCGHVHHFNVVGVFFDAANWKLGSFSCSSLYFRFFFSHLDLLEKFECSKVFIPSLHQAFLFSFRVNKYVKYKKNKIKSLHAGADLKTPLCAFCFFVFFPGTNSCSTLWGLFKFGDNWREQQQSMYKQREDACPREGRLHSMDE